LIDNQSQPLGKMSYDQAMWLAYDKGYDLVEVGPGAVPPVCKLIDYNKELYEKAKRARKQRAKQKSSEVKEIKLTYKISEHDLEVRAKRAEAFFSEGDRVRVFIILKGRENIFRGKAFELIEKFKEIVKANYEIPIKRVGNIYSAILTKK